MEQSFHISGKTLSSSERLKSKKIGNARERQQLYNSRAEIPSGPFEKLFFREFNKVWISSREKEQLEGRLQGYVVEIVELEVEEGEVLQIEAKWDENILADSVGETDVTLL